MIIEIQCLPSPAGTPDNPYAFIDGAIKVIQDSGCEYEVDALGTTIQGEPDVLWPLVRRVHESCLASGARGLVSVIKVEQAATNGPTIDSLTSKFRG